MAYSRVSNRAFESLFSQFMEVLDHKAKLSGCNPAMMDGYKLGYLNSFFAMEFASLNEEAQTALYDAIFERCVLLRRKNSDEELTRSVRNVKSA